MNKSRCPICEPLTSNPDVKVCPHCQELLLLSCPAPEETKLISQYCHN
jgi:hypothetical protein